MAGYSEYCSKLTESFFSSQICEIHMNQNVYQVFLSIKMMVPQVIYFFINQPKLGKPLGRKELGI